MTKKNQMTPSTRAKRILMDADSAALDELAIKNAELMEALRELLPCIEHLHARDEEAEETGNSMARWIGKCIKNAEAVLRKHSRRPT